MTQYRTEILRIKRIHRSNQSQIAIVTETRDYLDRHFENHMNLDLLSKVRGTSKYHLLRLFKRYYGLTPWQYLISRRLSKAKEYLVNGRTATETCFAVGFESPASFNTLFKKRIGKTPGLYQKEQLSKRQSGLES